MGMWESRALGEISKSLWELCCGFQRDVISIAWTRLPVIRGDAVLFPVRRSSFLGHPARSFWTAGVSNRLAE